MSQDEFTKLFKYVQEMRTEMNVRFDETASKKQFDQVMNSIDGLSKLITDYHQEMMMLAHKVDRMERWIHQIAKKTGVKLSYE